MTATPVLGIGEALRALRITADMTLDEVAESAGISPSYLSRAENNQVTPSANWVQLVSIAIGNKLAADATALKAAG